TVRHVPCHGIGQNARQVPLPVAIVPPRSKKRRRLKKGEQWLKPRSQNGSYESRNCLGVRAVLRQGRKLRSIYVKMLVNGCSTCGWLDPIPLIKITTIATKCLAVSTVIAAEFCKLCLLMIPL
uniref:Uncharacterized protein n=1 Tax=Parascaris univalens TaxID=6257 RepID=A0A915C9Y6_PARUN